MSTPVLAIEAVALSRHYGKGKKKVHVLNNINLTLPRGSAPPRRPSAPAHA